MPHGWKSIERASTVEGRHQRRTARRESAYRETMLRTRAPLCNCGQGAPATTPNLPTLSTRSPAPQNLSMRIRNVTGLPVLPQAQTMKPKLTNRPRVWLHQRAKDGLTHQNKLTANHFRSQKSKLNNAKWATQTSKPNYALWAALLDNPMMNPKIQETFGALNWPALSAKGMQHNVNKVAPLTVQVVQRTWKEKRLTCRTLPRAAAIQGVRQYLVNVNERYQIMVCGSPDGNPLQATTRCYIPDTENLTVDKEITSCKPKIGFGVKDTWETTLRCNQKP